MNNATLSEPTATLLLPNGQEISADGTMRDPAAEQAVEVLNARRSVQLVQKMQRNLGDLPDIPENINPVCCIMAYTSVGLNDVDIAKALNTTEENIKRLKALDIYAQFEKMFDERIFDDEQRNARHIISKHATVAANKMVELVDSKSGDLALMAASKVLSMAGVDKSAVNTGMTKLQIVMVDGDDLKKQSITINVGA